MTHSTHLLQPGETIPFECCRCHRTVSINGPMLDSYEMTSRVFLCGSCEADDHDAPTNRYRVSFVGRKVGAIGVTYPITIEGFAASPAAAQHAPYLSGFEHVRRIQIWPLK